MVAKNKITSRYSKDESFQHAFKRVAVFFKDLWDEYNHNEGHPLPVDSRIFEVMMTEELFSLGRSTGLQKAIKQQKAMDSDVPVKRLREYLVPYENLLDRVAEMFKEGKTVEDVAKMLQRLLRVILITEDELLYLEKLGLKNKMPDGWDWDHGDVKARLNEAEMEICPQANPNPHLNS